MSDEHFSAESRSRPEWYIRCVCGAEFTAPTHLQAQSEFVKHQDEEREK